MTLKDNLMTLYPQVAKIRAQIERRGRDEDILYTMLFKIIQELEAINAKLGP